MLRLSVKNNLKTIFRDPTTVLALLFALIMNFMYGFDFYHDYNMQTVDTALYLSESAEAYMINTVMNITYIPLERILFPFISVVIAVNLYKDRRMSLYDILRSSRLSFRQYYLSKIISYIITGFLLCFCLTAVYEVIYIFVQVPENPNFEWSTVIITQIVAMSAFYTSVLLIPCAWCVFLCALSGLTETGILMGCIYYYLPLMIASQKFTFWENYIHICPMKLVLYLQGWMSIPDGKWLTEQIGDSESLGIYSLFSDFSQGLTAYLIQILIYTALFTAAYFLLKRRFQKI